MESVDAYGQMMGFPVVGPRFVAHLKTWLSTIADETDQAFPNARVTIERGEPVIHKAPRRKLPTGLLSPQERRVFHLLIAGRTYAEIAQELIVSLNTVKTQVSSIYYKLGVSRRAEATAISQHLHLL